MIDIIVNNILSDIRVRLGSTIKTSCFDKSSFSSWYEAYGFMKEKLDMFWDQVKIKEEQPMREHLLGLSILAIYTIIMIDMRSQTRYPKIKTEP